jgi:uncharacterized protein (DUF58 family)
MRNTAQRLAARVARLWRLSRPDCEVTLRMRQRSLVVTFVVLGVWLVLQPTAFAFTGLMLAGSLMLVGYGWARSMAVHVLSQRTLRYTAVQVGDTLEEWVVLDNRSNLPAIWAEFVDHSTAPGYSISGVYVGQRKKAGQWRLHTTCTQRGVYTLGPWEVRMGDPLGIYEVRQVYSRQTEIVVYPPLAVLPPEIAQQRRTQGDRLPLRQPLSAETINATTTRPYAAGDTVRHIHWRTTARHADLFVKVFEPEASSVMWLLPDLDTAVQWGEGNESSLEKMIILTATLASQLLTRQLAVGLVLDAVHAQVIPPQLGQPHLWTILRALAMAQPSSSPLAETLVHARSIISTRDSTVILTPSIEPAWTGSLNALLPAAHGGLEVVLIDPATFGGSAGAAALAAMLREQGITTHVVGRDDIRPASAVYGDVRRWEFKMLGTGRIAVQQTPRAARPIAS